MDHERVAGVGSLGELPTSGCGPVTIFGKGCRCHTRLPPGKGKGDLQVGERQLERENEGSCCPVSVRFLLFFSLSHFLLLLRCFDLAAHFILASWCEHAWTTASARRTPTLEEGSFSRAYDLGFSVPRCFGVCRVLVLFRLEFHFVVLLRRSVSFPKVCRKAGRPTWGSFISAFLSANP